MRLIGCLLLILTVTPLAITYPASPSETDRISVVITTDKEAFAEGEPIPVILTIKNSSNVAVGIFPSFAPQVDPVFPDSVLVFSIIGPDGATVKRKLDDNRESAKRKAIEKSDFHELSPGWFFGGPIYVNLPPFAYKMGQRGTYRVRAELRFTAVEWLDNGEVREFDFPEGFLAEGVFVSNEIEVAILAE